jgi:hypothetical protein
MRRGGGGTRSEERGGRRRRAKAHFSRACGHSEPPHTSTCICGFCGVDMCVQLHVLRAWGWIESGTDISGAAEGSGDEAGIASGLVFEGDLCFECRSGLRQIWQCAAAQTRHALSITTCAFNPSLLHGSCEPLPRSTCSLRAAPFAHRRNVICYIEVMVRKDGVSAKQPAPRGLQGAGGWSPHPNPKRKAPLSEGFSGHNESATSSQQPASAPGRGPRARPEPCALRGETRNPDPQQATQWQRSQNLTSASGDAIWGAHRPNYIHGQFGGIFLSPRYPRPPRAPPW